MRRQDFYRKFSTYEEALAYVKAQPFNPYISVSNPTQLINSTDPSAWYIIETHWPAD